VVLAALGAAAACAPEQAGSADLVTIPGINRDLTARIEAADRLAADGRWLEAVDACLDLVRENGDDLVPADTAGQSLATGQRFLPARWLLAQRLVRWGAPAWKVCRQRLDGAAAKWLARGIEARDPALLRKIVEEAFCSRAAETALEWLGDLALERGHFAEAQAWWRLLAVPASEAGEARQQGPLLYPDPTPAVVARVRAKQILTLCFEAEGYLVPAELAAYRKLHGNATGTLAGKTGKYADLLLALWKDGQGVLPPEEAEWPTFAGAASRQRVMPGAVSPRLWADGPAWRVRLDSGELISPSAAAKAPAARPTARQLAVFPVIAGRMAHVADTRFVRGFDLRSGRLSYQYDLLDGRDLPGGESMTLKYPVSQDVQCSLTVADGDIYARLGQPTVGPVREGKGGESWLVCLRPPATAAAPPGKAAKLERWAVRVRGKEGEAVSLEGAPVVRDGSVFIVASHVAQGRTTAVLHCYSAETGAPRWEVDLCEGPEFSPAAPERSRHYLLTEAGPLLVYASNAGAVVAVEADTGKRAWAVRYAGRTPKAAAGRGPCPAVAVRQRVYVAPSDLDRLLCLEAATGRSLWEREAADVVHVYGVFEDQLLFATGSGLRTYQALTGADGWCRPGVGSLGSLGRGLLADGWVFWPTQDPRLPCRALNLADGGLTRGPDGYEPGQLAALPAGNWALGQGCLVIATTEELVGFVPPPTLGGNGGT
jgi:outer membrane protein assembly factor BamB